VVDFLPGRVEGFVYADVNDNGVMDPIDPPMGPERGIGDIEVYLTGTTIFGDPDIDPNTPGVQTSIMKRTDVTGKYVFDNLVPGTYVISLDNPATSATVESPELFIDGRETLGTKPAGDLGTMTILGNNRFQIGFAEGGTQISNLNFGVLGLSPQYVNIRDHLTTSTTNGAVFGVNKSAAPASQQFWYSRYDGWAGTTHMSLSVSSDLTTAVLGWNDAQGTHTVSLNFQTHWQNIRIMGQEGNNVVVRIVGTLGQLAALPTHVLTPGGGQGEGQYGDAEDEVFAGW
jgi:hypothetical protein